MEWKVFSLLTVFEMHCGLCYLMLALPPSLQPCAIIRQVAPLSPEQSQHLDWRVWIPLSSRSPMRLKDTPVSLVFGILLKK